MQLVCVDLLWTLLIFCWLVHVRCEQPSRYVEIKGDCPSALESKSFLTCDCDNCHLYCLHDEENRRYLISLDERRVDKGNCPYLNGPHKYYDQRQCEEKDGTCPEEEYSLGNNMYIFSACFPSPTSPEPTGDDKGIDCDRSAIVMTPSIIVACIISVAIGIVIGIAIGIVIGNKNTFIQGFGKKRPKGKTTSEEEIPMIDGQGSALGTVNRRVEDGGGRDLAETQPAGTTHNDAVTVQCSESTLFPNQMVTQPQFATQPTSGAMTSSFGSSGSNTVLQSPLGFPSMTRTASSASVPESVFSFPKVETAGQLESSDGIEPLGQTIEVPARIGSSSFQPSLTAWSSSSFTGNQVNSSIPGSTPSGNHLQYDIIDVRYTSKTNLYGKTSMMPATATSNLQKSLTGLGTIQTAQACSVATDISDIGGTKTTITAAGMSTTATTAPSAGFNLPRTTRTVQPVSAPEKTVGITSGILPKPQEQENH